MIEEAYFWKNLADALLDIKGIEKQKFYERIEPVKKIWEMKDIEATSLEIQKAAKNKVEYVKESVSEIIEEMR